MNYIFDHETNVCIDCGGRDDLAHYENPDVPDERIVICDDCAAMDFYYHDIVCRPSDALRRSIISAQSA